MKSQLLKLVLLATAVNLSSNAWANTAANVKTGSADLTTSTNFSATPGTGTDVTFLSATTYSPTAFTLNSSESWGTLDDLNSTPLTINNTSGTADALTLSAAPANSTSGANSKDYLYLASGSNLSIGNSSTAALAVNLGGTGHTAASGNIDNNGSLTIGAGTVLSFNGSSSSQSLSLTGSGTTNLAGEFTTGDTNTLIVNSTGTLSVSGTSASTGLGAVLSNFTLTAGTVDLGTATANSGKVAGNVIINGGTFLEGAGGTITGASSTSLTVTGGTVTLGGTNSMGGAVGTTIDNGAAVNLTGTLASVVFLGSSTLGGGKLNYGKTGGGSTSVTSTTLNAGASSVTTTATSGSVNTLGLGAITRNVGSTVDFSTSSEGAITTTTPNANISGGMQTILGGFATWNAGTNWAVSGTGATAGTISGLSTFSPSFTGGTNVDVASGTSAPASMTVNSIRFNAAAVSTVNLAGALTVATGGILETINVGAHNDSINNSTITTGNGQDLIVIQGDTNGSLTINSVIVGTGLGLTKSGAGALVVTGANTYSGNTYVDAGSLEFQNAGSFYSSSPGGVTAANAAQVSVYGGATLTLGVGGATGFTAGDVSTVLGTGGATFASGTNIGFDTTGAGTGGFTYGSAIADPASGPRGLVKLGANALILSNAAGSTYTNGTTISQGTIYADNAGGSAYSAPTTSSHAVTATNTANSATGTGAVTVNSTGVLAGSGTIASTGVTVNGGASLVSGDAQTAAPTVSGNGLTFRNTPITVGSLSGTANLTFSLGAGNTNGSSFFSVNNPNANTTYMSLTGSTVMNFTTGSAVSVSLVDLTNGNLNLRLATPYLLVQATSNLDYIGLVTSIDGKASDATLDGNGYVLGVYTGGNAVGAYTYNTISINELGPDGVTGLADTTTSDPGYFQPQLYLYNGDLEVVPEPGTWAMMLGGLLVLVLKLRRRGSEGENLSLRKTERRATVAAAE